MREAARYGVTCLSPQLLGRQRLRGLQFKAISGQILETLPGKITKAKRSGGVTQVVEPLPSKREALSLNPMLERKKKKERDRLSL
jgi:hypothetical protein